MLFELKGNTTEGETKLSEESRGEPRCSDTTRGEDEGGLRTVKAEAEGEWRKATGDGRWRWTMGDR
jgi:hypothetical protein